MQLTERPGRIAGLVAGVAVAGWIVLAVLQVADGGFYSDDFGIQWDWAMRGYPEVFDWQLEILGAKPLLGLALPTSYEVLGTDPVWHQVLAVSLWLAAAALFYPVLRGLRFEPRDAVPIALLALLFPWAMGVRLWPAGSLNNFAVLLLFAGFLLALWGLRVGGRRGLAIHVAAVACYAASILAYDATTFLAAALWPAYVWLYGRRPALPRAAMDLAVVAAAAIWTASNTKKHIADFADQVGHIPDIAREGAHLFAASLVPAATPADFPPALTIAIVAGSLAVLAAALMRRRRSPGDSAQRSEPNWPVVAAVALGALAACWVVYVPQAFYTPSFPGLEDRVNVVALYPAAVLVWAVLRSAGSLFGKSGYVIAIAAAATILAGYWAQDLRQQRDYAEAAELQEPVLAAVEDASPPESALVLTFNHPAQVGDGIPVFNQSWDLHPAAQLRTGTMIQTYPVFEGAELRCTPKGVAVDELPTPLYWTISLKLRGTPGITPYGQVLFIDVADNRHGLIDSQERCERALQEFPPGPWDS